VGKASPISLSGNCRFKHKVVDKKVAGVKTPASIIMTPQKKQKD